MLDPTCFPDHRKIDTQDINAYKEILGKLEKNDPELTKIYFYNDLKNTTAFEITNQLKSNTKILSLKINGNGLTEKGIEAIAIMLKHNSSLTHLHILCTEHHKEHAEIFFDAIKGHPTLVTILLGTSREFTPETVKKYMDANPNLCCEVLNYSLYQHLEIDKSIQNQIRNNVGITEKVYNFISNGACQDLFNMRNDLTNINAYIKYRLDQIDTTGVSKQKFINFCKLASSGYMDILCSSPELPIELISMIIDNICKIGSTVTQNQASESKGI